MDLMLESLQAYLHVVRSHPTTWRLVLVPPPGAPEILRNRIASGRQGRRCSASLIEAVQPALSPDESSLSTRSSPGRTSWPSTDEYARLHPRRPGPLSDRALARPRALDPRTGKDRRDPTTEERRRWSLLMGRSRPAWTTPPRSPSCTRSSSASARRSSPTRSRRSSERRELLGALAGMLIGHRDADRGGDELATSASTRRSPTDLIEVLGVAGRAAYAAEHLATWMAPEPRHADPALLRLAAARTCSRSPRA